MVRAQLLAKRLPYRIYISIDSFTFDEKFVSKNRKVIDENEYSIYFKRGAKNSANTPFSSVNNSNKIVYNSSFNFKATMFQKKSRFSKKILYFVLQKRKIGTLVVVSEAKASIDLGKYAKNMDEEFNSIGFTETLKLGSIGSIQIGITLETIDMSTTSTIMTTMDDMTALDTEYELDEEELDDEFNPETKSSMKETRTLRSKIQSLQNEMSIFSKETPKVLNEDTERSNNADAFLISELKQELERVKSDYEEAQRTLKLQLDEERANLQQMKEGYQNQMKVKEKEVEMLRLQLESLLSESSTDNAVELNNLKKKYETTIKELESIQESRQKFYESEKKKDELRIKELQIELMDYQSMASRNAKLKKENQMKMDDSTLKSLTAELQQLKKEKSIQEKKDQEYKSKIEELHKKLQEFEYTKLSEDLKKEVEINSIKERAIKSEQQAMKLYDELDTKIASEAALTAEVKDLELQIASIEAEKLVAEEKLRTDLEYSQSRIQELESVLTKKNSNGIVLEGYMTKRGRFFKTWRRRYFVLFQSKYLTYSKIRNGNLSGGVIVKSVKCIRSRSRNAFEVSAVNRVLLCYPDSNEEYDAWKEIFIDINVLKPT